MKKIIILVFLLLVVSCTPEIKERIDNSADLEPDNVIISKEAPKEQPIPKIEESQKSKQPVVKEVEQPKEQIEPEKNIEEKPVETQFYNDTRWMRIDMQNVKTDEIFTIDSLKGETIFVEPYSVNCGTCSEQKLKLSEFISENNESYTYISVNVDLNAEKDQTIKQMDLYGYDWSFVLASNQLKDSIVKQFGNRAIKYAQNPLILVCKNQQAYLFEGGVKGKYRLNEALSNC